MAFRRRFVSRLPPLSWTFLVPSHPRLSMPSLVEILQFYLLSFSLVRVCLPTLRARQLSLQALYLPEVVRQLLKALLLQVLLIVDSAY